MLLPIPDVLTADEVARAREIFARAGWVDGRVPSQRDLALGMHHQLQGRGIHLHQRINAVPAPAVLEAQPLLQRQLAVERRGRQTQRGHAGVLRRARWRRGAAGEEAASQDHARGGDQALHSCSSTASRRLFSAT